MINRFLWLNSKWMHSIKWPKLLTTRVSHGFVAASNFVPRMQMKKLKKVKKKERNSMKTTRKPKAEPRKREEQPENFLNFMKLN